MVTISSLHKTPMELEDLKKEVGHFKEVIHYNTEVKHSTGYWVKILEASIKEIPV